MTEDAPRRHARDAGAQQRFASDPRQSAWVSASAGTGKTRLLTERVLRLLLAGARPSGILCLTFTKAAAAEMAGRVSDTLGKWALLPDAKLERELADLLEHGPVPEEMLRARQLFARTLDFPGGLRLQTIHAFCEAVLKRFPLEAGIAPYFQVADERVAAELIAAATNDLLALAAGDSESDLARALAVLAAESDEGGLQDVLGAIAQQRWRFSALLDRHGGRVQAAAALSRALGLPAGATPAKLIEAYVASVDAAAIKSVIAAMHEGTKTDRELADAMGQWLRLGDRAAGFRDLWRPVFITAEGTPRKKLMTVGIARKSPELAEHLQAEQDRVVALDALLKAAALAELSTAMLVLAESLIDAYDAKKSARATLDYLDLILNTKNLLRRQGALDWVLYKLDRGFDHILVDEAQDTSPEQWDLIRAIADEFFSGEGARAIDRTMFAVGDEKQSIFSFQGADPKIFSETRDHFARLAKAAGKLFHEAPRNLNFRSVEAVLKVVDNVFAADRARVGVASGEVRHLPHRNGEGGLVELWPLARGTVNDAADPWDAPLDYMGRSHPVAILAGRIADTIQRWLASGEILESEGRAIVPGDIMILVCHRRPFLETMVRTLRQRNLPVAGADRMVLADHIAIKDLLAVAEFALLPEDDLTLACVLKSPLFGFDDDQLFDLCNRRKVSLWSELRRRAVQRPHWASAVSELEAWMAAADFTPPFEFYAKILGAGRGRRRLLARLGPEASDALDEFLNAALGFERSHAPSLQGFLHWFRAGGAEVKRDLEKPGGEIRVMTVHGAKGLESNIVFLPETCNQPTGKHDPKFFWPETGGPKSKPLFAAVWRAGDDVAATRAAREAHRQRQREEYRRQLYVAMTRARDRLYVCGWLGSSKDDAQAPEGCWYDLVQATMQGDGVTEAPLPWGETGGETGRETALRNQLPQSAKIAAGADVAAARSTPAAPAWLRDPAPPEASPPRPLMPSGEAPSRFEDADAGVISPLPGVEDRAVRRLAFRRGTLVHGLLEILCLVAAPRRGEAGLRWLKVQAPDFDLAGAQALVDSVTQLLVKPEFSEIFAEGSIAEATLSGRIGEHVISGQVDRLRVTDDRVLVVDFKTNRVPPAMPDQVPLVYLRQMAAYRALLQKIFPGRAVVAGLLWTEAPALMWLDGELLDNLALSPRLDDGGAAP